jgi:hypothetical protein
MSINMNLHNTQLYTHILNKKNYIIHHVLSLSTFEIQFPSLQHILPTDHRKMQSYCSLDSIDKPLSLCWNVDVLRKSFITLSFEECRSPDNTIYRIVNRIPYVISVHGEAQLFIVMLF